MRVRVRLTVAALIDSSFPFERESGLIGTVAVPPGRLWRGQDSNLRRQSQRVSSASPLTAREPRQGSASVPSRACAMTASG